MQFIDSQSNCFFDIFVRDLIGHQDDANTGAELVDSVRATVAWYAANEPTENIVPANQAAAFMAWMDSRRADLVIVATRALEA